MSSATRLRLFRTTAFKLAVGYLVVFGLFAAALIGYIVIETSSIVVRETSNRLTQDARRLGQHYQRGGINALFVAMQDSANGPGNRLYALIAPDGQELVNNIGLLPQGIARERGLVRFRYTQSSFEGLQRDSRAIVRVIPIEGGYRALIGVDIGQTDVVRNAVRRAALISLITLTILGILGWLYIDRRVLKRLEGISATTGRIMDGELSQRIAIMGTGDEFDRLGEQLNIMLERLERSMDGLKEVSDNIAHDLRTPLTRMRNQMEDALRQPPEAQADRAALENSLEEADHLMATFQALLTISRVEAGGTRHTLDDVELVSVVTDVLELYEPVAEDKGIGLAFDGPSAPIHATLNRELVGLAVANLIDNALKYGAKSGGHVRLALATRADRAIISVVDDGPGIPGQDLERVRERFVRLDKSRTAEGSGLGLALVEAVAVFHNGSLDLGDAKPGLKAELILPIGDPEAKEREDAS